MDAEAQLDSFIGKFDRAVATLTKSLCARLKPRLPGAVIMAYDNDGALAIGFGAVAKLKQAVLSLAVYPGRPSLRFIWGKDLPDPHDLLRGGGNQLRFARPPNVDVLDDPRVDL